MAWFIIWKKWRWTVLRATALIGPLIAIEIAFFFANITKIVEGGWLPLTIAAFSVARDVYLGQRAMTCFADPLAAAMQISTG